MASRVGGIPEIVEDGVGGLLFDPADEDDMARVFARLAAEPGLRARLRAGVPRVKTIAEDAADWASRYAAMAARKRASCRIGEADLYAASLGDATLTDAVGRARRYAEGGRAAMARRVVEDAFGGRVDAETLRRVAPGSGGVDA